MKLKTLIFTYLFLVISFQFCFAQEKPEAVLVAESRNINCEVFSAQIDNLIIAVNNTPNSIGYILINGNKTNTFQKYVIKSLIKEFSLFRKVDLNKIIFLNGKDEESAVTQFWIVPFGADKPQFVEENWDYKLPSTTKSFIVHANSWFYEICPEIFSFKFYSQFLIANPDLRGHLVVYENSIDSFHRIEKKLIKTLVNKNNVPRNQLKFFFVKRKTRDVEFWYVSKQIK